MRRMILLAEFTAAIPEAGRPPALGPVSLPEKPVQLDALKHLCETWRNRVDFRDGYIQLTSATPCTWPNEQKTL